MNMTHLVGPKLHWNEKSFWFIRLNVATGTHNERRLLTHWEASDINANLHSMHCDVRYVLEPQRKDVTE